MRYEPAADKGPRSTAELKATYAAARGKFFENPQTISALRLALAREREAHRASIQRLEDAVAPLKAELALEKGKTADLKARLDVALVDRPAVLADFVDRKKYAFSRVVALICKAHGVTEDEIKSVDRSYHVGRARMHLIDILTTHRPDLSGSRVGRLICRDHSTVCNARQRWPHVKHMVQWAIGEFERLVALETE